MANLLIVYTKFYNYKRNQQDMINNSPQELRQSIDKMIIDNKKHNKQEEQNQKLLEHLPKSFIGFLSARSIQVSQMMAKIPRFIRVKPGYQTNQNLLAKQMGVSSEQIIKIDRQFFALQPSIKINNTKPYQQGHIYGIDFSSSIPIRCLHVLPGHKILELCGAPGNKSMYLADRVQDIQITSVQINENRAQIMKNLIKKYKLQGQISVVVADATKYKSETIFDRVLIDAQCTHEGSIKHIKKFIKSSNNEDNKTKKKRQKFLTSQQQKQYDKNNSNSYTSVINRTNQWSEQDFEQRFLDPFKLKNLQALQLNFLQNGFSLLKQSGILVYSTCSFDKNQNQHLIKKFICSYNNNEGNLTQIIIMDAVEGLQSNLGFERCEQLPEAIRLSPVVTRSGGMFVCKLKKIAKLATNSEQKCKH